MIISNLSPDSLKEFPNLNAVFLLNHRHYWVERIGYFTYITESIHFILKMVWENIALTYFAHSKVRLEEVSVFVWPWN